MTSVKGNIMSARKRNRPIKNFEYSIVISPVYENKVRNSLENNDDIRIAKTKGKVYIRCNSKGITWNEAVLTHLRKVQELEIPVKWIEDSTWPSP
jgi:hypothetical protein